MDSKKWDPQPPLINFGIVCGTILLLYLYCAWCWWRTERGSCACTPQKNVKNFLGVAVTKGNKFQIKNGSRKHQSCVYLRVILESFLRGGHAQGLLRIIVPLAHFLAPLKRISAHAPACQQENLPNYAAHGNMGGTPIFRKQTFLLYYYARHSEPIKRSTICKISSLSTNRQISE